MLPIIVTVGPLASASANTISTSQSHNGAFGLALNGASSTGFSATSICAAQAVAGAGDLTINGALANGGLAQITNTGYVAITSAGDDSGITFTVIGTMSTPGGFFAQKEIVTGANASVVVSTKKFWKVTTVTASGAAAGNVSVGVNGVAMLDMARRVLITSAGNDSANAFTVYGTDWNGAPISQAVTGANASTAVTTIDFKTVTSILTSAATASAVTVGTNGVAASRPIFLDTFAFPQVAIQTTASGTVNYTVQQSLDDPNDVGSANVTWVNHPDSALVAATATAQGNYAYAPRVMRVVLNSGSGSVKVTAIQAASVPV